MPDSTSEKRTEQGKKFDSSPSHEHRDIEDSERHQFVRSAAEQTFDVTSMRRLHDNAVCRPVNDPRRNFAVSASAV